MVAADQHHLAIAELMQVKQGLAQSRRQPFTGVDQITQQQQLIRLPAVTEVQQRIQRAPIAIAGQRNSVGLEGFRLAQVQVGQHQLPAQRSPQGTFGKEPQGFLAPGPVEAIHQRSRSGPGRPGCTAALHPGITLASSIEGIVARFQRTNQSPQGPPPWLPNKLSGNLTTPGLQ